MFFDWFLLVGIWFYGLFLWKWFKIVYMYLLVLKVGKFKIYVICNKVFNNWFV